MKRRLYARSILFVAVSFACGTASADIPKHLIAADQAIAEALADVSRLRNSASKLASDDAGLNAALDEYKRGIAQLDDPALLGVAAKSYTLGAKSFDLRIDAARMSAKAGRKEQALQLLDDGVRRVLLPDFMPLFQRPEFAGLQDDARFQHLLKIQRLPATMGTQSAIATPYKAVLTDAEKVAGLSLFWAEARRSFVHFAQVPDLDWDAAYLSLLPRVLAARDLREYYDVMLRVAPLLQDAHANIYPPPELQQVFYSRPALATSLIGDRVLVTAVRNKDLQERIRVGDEIVTVDGHPVRDYAARFVAPLASSSTPQDREVRLYNYQLLTGEAGTRVKLGLRRADGRAIEEAVERGQVQNVEAAPAFALKKLPGNVLYLSLDHFQGDKAQTAFEAALDEILRADALILDVRNNGGGSGINGLNILSYLTVQPVPVPRTYERRESNIMRARRDVIALLAPEGVGGAPYAVPRKATFQGKVAVLTGPKTFSAAEDFVASFVALRRGLVVGKPTAGSTGQPLMFKLPGGGTARVTVKHDTMPDGREFVGKGIMPDLVAETTVEGIRAGRDEVLDAAVAALTGKKVN